jgi:HD-GYP domain-containing protein (c-di-GMP phosphodiesterase class II)
MIENAKRFVAVMASTLSNCALYSAEHEAVEELTRKALSILEEIIAETGDLEIMVVESDLVVNKTPLRDMGVHGAGLVRRLKRKGLSRVDFLRDITFQELKQFMMEAADPDRQMSILPHIKTGVIDVRLSGITFDMDIDAEGLSRIASLQSERARRVYQGISSQGRINISGIEEIVATFIDAFRRKAGILKLISPVASPRDHISVHGVNVAALSMYQAETLGARDELLYDIGVAALLHDVGRLFIPQEIREKEGILEDREWEEIQRHTVSGARYLAKAEGLTRLAPLVALEHHLRYDGQGYPRRVARERKQHLFTQIVTVADFFDSMRSRKKYRGGRGTAEVLAMMDRNAGTEFNPFLASNFSKVIAHAMHSSS